MLKHLALIDSIHSAKFFMELNNNLDKWDIYTMRLSTYDFLIYKNIQCHDISYGIEDKHITKQLSESQKFVDKALFDLDREIGVQICQICNINNQDIFNVLYKYLNQYTHMGHVLFSKFLREKFKNNRYIEAHYFKSRIDDSRLFAPSETFTKLSNKYNITNKIHDCNKKNNFIKYSCFNYIKKLLLKLKYLFIRIRKYNINNILFSIKIKNPFYTKMKTGIKYGLIIYPKYRSTLNLFRHFNIRPIFVTDKNWNKIKNQVDSNNYNLIIKKINLFLESLSINTVSDHSNFKRIIIDDFRINYTHYLAPILFYKNIINNFNLKLIMWDLPTCTTPHLHLLVAYFLKNKITVIGRQHGGCYVSQNMGSIHFDSDYNYCSIFFSYGFTFEDFKKTYPEKDLLFKIIPTGSIKNKINDVHQKIDILFPITLSFSQIYSGRNEGVLNNYQEIILGALEKRTDLISVIKPIKNYNEDNYCWTYRIKNYSRINIVSGITLVNYLKKTKPSLIIIEYPSTTLYDIIDLDVDVFILKDKIYPFSSEAEKLLIKRVNIYDNIYSMEDAIMNYKKDSSRNKRNNLFYNKYVNNGSMKHAYSDLCSIL